jgi:hypothetical protein
MRPSRLIGMDQLAETLAWCTDIREAAREVQRTSKFHPSSLAWHRSVVIGDITAKALPRISLTHLAQFIYTAGILQCIRPILAS